MCRTRKSRIPTVIYYKNHIDGTIESKFHRSIIDLIDKAFVYDSLKMFSREQEKYFTGFIKACEIMHANYKANKRNIYDGVDATFESLDQFLGNYTGVDDAQYSS